MMVGETLIKVLETTVPESIAESSISGITELSETLSAIQKEVPREIINERVATILQDEAFRTEILEATYPDIWRIHDFSEHCRFEAQLPDNLHKANDYQHSKHCNEQLRQAYENGNLNTEQFTDRQLEQIHNGDKPEGYTWHHHEVPGRMQLVDSEIHARTPHIGGRSLWGGGSEAR